jgi:hypothetical protein
MAHAFSIRAVTSVSRAASCDRRATPESLEEVGHIQVVFLLEDHRAAAGRGAVK